MINMFHLSATASYQIVGLVILLIASMIFVCIKVKIHQFSFYRLFRNIDFKDLIMMSLITLTYIALSSINYGDRFKQGHWFGDIESKTLTITLARPVQLSQINYYLGLSSGIIEVSVETEAKQEFMLSKVNTNESIPLVFRWINVNLTGSAKITKIFFQIAKPIVEVKQLAIVDMNKNYINDYKVSSNPYDKRDDLSGLTLQIVPEHFQMSSLWNSVAIWDEVYYATTAFQLVNFLPPYVYVHPPLGMLLIGVGILVFGMNPFGWRFLPLLSGIFILPLVYVFTKKISKSRVAASIASILLCFDFMHYIICRMASIDSIVTLFIFTEYFLLYLYLQSRIEQNNWQESFRYLFGAGVMFAFAISVKWSALFSVLPIVITLIYAEFIVEKSRVDLINKAFVLIASFIIIPFVIYSLSYLPNYMISQEPNFIDFIIHMQQKIINYHTRDVLIQHSSFSSKWWTWPLDIRPFTIYTYGNNLKKSLSTILLMGNPAIWWFSVLAILIFIINQINNYIRYCKINYGMLFVLIIIFCQYLPYSLFKRDSFIYYFYTVTPFLFMITAFVLAELWHATERSLRVFVIIYLLLVVFLFVVFFPILAAIEVPKNYITGFLLWYKTWTLL